MIFAPARDNPPQRDLSPTDLVSRLPWKEHEAEMAGGEPITSLPKNVLAALARSLAMYSSMPEEIAWGHIKARGFDPPELDGQGARMRGALLKILADEVLAESKAESEGDGFEPESTSNARPTTSRGC